MVWRGFTHPWDPWEELNEVEDEMAHLFAGAYGAASHEFPPLNIWTNDEGAFVMAEVPGMSAGQLEVAVINDTLILRGSRLQEELPEGSHYHRRERGFGRIIWLGTVGAVRPRARMPGLRPVHTVHPPAIPGRPGSGGGAGPGWHGADPHPACRGESTASHRSARGVTHASQNPLRESTWMMTRRP